MIRYLVAGAVLAFGASSFEARAISLTVDNITGVWTSASGATANGLNTSTITWGQPLFRHAPLSSYSFSGVNTPTQAFQPGSEFTLGTFTHLNMPIYGPSITDAVLSLSIKGTVTGGTQFNVTSTFEFSHEETPNTSLWCCRDIVKAITNPEKSTTLSINGLTYLFTFGGFLVGDQTFEEFRTKELHSNIATLRGSFTQVGPGPGPEPSPVPLPAALPLFASALGLAGVLGYRRQRRSA